LNLKLFFQSRGALVFLGLFFLIATAGQWFLGLENLYSRAPQADTFAIAFVKTQCKLLFQQSNKFIARVCLNIVLVIAIFWQVLKLSKLAFGKNTPPWFLVFIVFSNLLIWFFSLQNAHELLIFFLFLFCLQQMLVQTEQSQKWTLTLAAFLLALCGFEGFVWLLLLAIFSFSEYVLNHFSKNIFGKYMASYRRYSLGFEETLKPQNWLKNIGYSLGFGLLVFVLLEMYLFQRLNWQLSDFQHFIKRLSRNFLSFMGLGTSSFWVFVGVVYAQLGGIRFFNKIELRWLLLFVVLFFAVFIFSLFEVRFFSVLPLVFVLQVFSLKLAFALYADTKP
jgi:hypothetical protein